MTVFEKARTFVYRNARPMDQARFPFHFEKDSKGTVRNALMCYQNMDGAAATRWNRTAGIPTPFRRTQSPYLTSCMKSAGKILPTPLSRGWYVFVPAERISSDTAGALLRKAAMTIPMRRGGIPTV